MKWKRILLTLLVLILIPTVAVEAASSAGITISASGFVCGAPGGFTITYINDYELGLSWTQGLNANNTMVRAAYGRYPDNLTDGYLVYYGNGTFCNDTAVNLDETASLVYYRAWSQNVARVYEDIGASEWFEGDGMKLIAVIILALGLMIPAFIWKKQALMVAAAFVWVGFAFWNRTITPTWGTCDIYEILFYVGIVMCMLCTAEGILMARSIHGDKLVGEQLRKKEAFRTPQQEYAEEYNSMMESVSAISGKRRKKDDD